MIFPVQLLKVKLPGCSTLDELQIGADKVKMPAGPDEFITETGMEVFISRIF